MTEERQQRSSSWVPVLLVLLVPCLLPCTYCGHKTYRIRRHDAAFAATARGMPKAQVVQLLPGPHEVSDSTHADFLYWDDTKLGSIATVTSPVVVRCTVKTWYLPITWEYVFDDTGKLVGRHRYD